jgi:hypothetical protein
MSYIDDLIDDGTNFRVDRRHESASFRPLSDSAPDIDCFQSVVRSLRANQGDGYTVKIEHKMSDRGENLIDLVVVMLDPA